MNTRSWQGSLLWRKKLVEAVHIYEKLKFVFTSRNEKEHTIMDKSPLIVVLG